MMRKLLLAILLFSMAGTLADLVLMDHYQDWWQVIPLGVIGLALIVLADHGLRRTSTGIRALQAVMALFVVAGVAGVILHFRTSADFQREIDDAMGGLRLVKAVLMSKVPPTLAPLTMLQMGLVGLVYCWRHPYLRAASLKGEEQ